MLTSAGWPIASRASCRPAPPPSSARRPRSTWSPPPLPPRARAPSHAAHALELGYDAVLLNTAIAKAADPVAMANAFRLGCDAGRTAYEAGLMNARDFASPSTPVVGTPFWHAVS